MIDDGVSVKNVACRSFFFFSSSWTNLFLENLYKSLASASVSIN